MSWNDKTWTLEPSFCKECGKEFYPTPMHVYKDERGIFCSWTCYRKEYHEKQELKKRTSRQIEKYTLDNVYIKTYKDAVDAAIDICGQEQRVRKACREGIIYKNHLWRYKNYEMPKM